MAYVHTVEGPCLRLGLNGRLILLRPLAVAGSAAVDLVLYQPADDTIVFASNLHGNPITADARKSYQLLSWMIAAVISLLMVAVHNRLDLCRSHQPLKVLRNQLEHDRLTADQPKRAPRPSSSVGNCS